MAPLQSGFLLAFILLVASHVADSVKVIVGDQLKVPVNCEPGESVSLQRITINGPRDVATGQSGQWKVSREEDRDRIEMDSSNTNIVFTHTLFTDGGIYELKCSTSGTKHVQLEVVFASEKSVTQGEKVTLPCYVKTIRGTNLPGWWEKNGKRLCVKNFDSEGCSGTPGDRLTVSTDWTNTGDLTLTIEGAQLEDGGDYFCYIQDEKQSKSGTPAAVRLTVTEKKTHQMIINSTAAPRDPTPNCAGHTQPWQISTWVLVAILLVLLIFYLWRSGKLSCDSRKLYEVVRRSCPASNSGEAATINKLDDRVSHVADFV